MPESGDSARPRAARRGSRRPIAPRAGGPSCSDARGFLGTTLLRPAEAGGWWLTIDRWNSAADFDAFGDKYGDEYLILDAELDGIAGEEEFVGAFEASDAALFTW